MPIVHNTTDGGESPSSSSNSAASDAFFVDIGVADLDIDDDIGEVDELTENDDDNDGDDDDVDNDGSFYTDRHQLIQSANRTVLRSTSGNGRPRYTAQSFAAYTSAGGIAGRSDSVQRSRQRSSKLYSPWTIFSLTLLFLLFLYIPLFNTFRESAGMYPIPGWELNTTRDTTYYVLPQYNTTLIEPVNVCKDRLFLLMVVCSSAANFEIRDTIRQTWANTTEFNYSFFRKAHAKMRGQYLEINFPNWSNFTTNATTNIGHRASLDDDAMAANVGGQSPKPRQRADFSDFAVKVVFLVGQTPSNETQARIVTEAEQFGDLIQESFLDSYNNLTLKTIMMLKWVTANCGDRVEFLMKCDDDTFVNVPNLLHIMLGGTMPVYNATLADFDQSTVRTRSARNRLRSTEPDFLIGSRFCNSKPISNTNSKWYTPVYMYSGSIYPNYLSGTGYVMSMNVASRLYNVSLVTPIFHLEDVYLTGICAEAAHIRPINHQLFSYTNYHNPCELKGTITKHQLTAAQMRHAYAFVHNATSANCPQPNRYQHVRKVKTNTRSCT